MRFRRRKDTRQEQLIEAQRELAEVRRQGTARQPLIRRLEKHKRENHFAERFRTALEQKKRGTA
jgi:hypothetical protein